MKQTSSTIGAIIGATLAGAGFFKLLAGISQGAGAETVNPTTAIGGIALMLLCLKPGGVLGQLWRSTKLTLKNIPALFPLALVFGGVGHILMVKFGPVLVPWQPDPANQQFVMLAKQLGHMVFLLIWFPLTFPLVNAAAIYCWRKDDKEGKAASFSEAYGFAKARYGRMVGPHAKAYALIALGMIILIPGIVYGLWFAFVDPITATDDKSKNPLMRSRKLTQGRRGKLLRAWLPYAVFASGNAVAPLLDELVELGGTYSMLLYGTFNALLLVIMKMSMNGFYEERLEDARRRRAEQEPAAKNEAEAGEPVADA